jgi:signal transduction histidine kinase/ActR/RegA family two-component response regulator
MSSHPLELIRKLSLDLLERADVIEPMLDLLPVGIAIADDPLCAATRINPALARQLGLDEARHTSLSTPPFSRPPLKSFTNGRPMTLEDRPMYQAARSGREVKGKVIDVVRGDGSHLTLMEYAIPLLDGCGKVRGAIGVFMDITEHRRIEEEQRFLAHASTFLSSSLDYETTLRALARLAVPMFGDYCAVDVLKEDGTFARVELIVDDPTRREIGEGLKRYPPRLTVEGPAVHAIKSGEPFVDNDTGPEKAARSAQTPEHLELLRRFAVRSFQMVPLRSRGRTLGLFTTGSFSGRQYNEQDLALALDVAARAGLALDNAMLYRTAQEADRLKEDFLATLSHELRTPLNALLGWMHILKMPSADELTRNRALESIERNARAQAILINDLIDVSRAMRGKLRVESTPVDLSAVILDAIDSIRPAVRARDLDLNLSIGALDGQVWGDADRLEQVMWNLLSNAVKFTRPGGRIDITVEETSENVRITVADNGVGIDSAFLPHVFERFRQADSSSTRAQSGLGLGLAIVRNLVDLHGGTVTVHSAGIDRGASFAVILPTRRLPDAAGGPEIPVVAAPSLNGIRVLAVDDDQDSRELILLTVRAAEANVMVVSSAARALDAISTFRPHVVISDLAMPGMDGYALVRAIAATVDNPPPVIAMSGHVNERDVQESLAAGFARHLGKPADYQRLVETIAELAKSVNFAE